MLLTDNVINHIRPLLLHKSVQLLKIRLSSNWLKLKFSHFRLALIPTS